MRQEREKRILRAAEYIVEHRATVRETAKRFGVSKSTIHKDVTERIARLDEQGGTSSARGRGHAGKIQARKVKTEIVLAGCVPCAYNKMSEYDFCYG